MDASRFLTRNPSAGAPFSRLVALRRAIGALLLAVIVVAPLGAARSPSGPPERISPANNLDHVSPAVAANAAGSVVVWQGFDLLTSTYEIFARRYDAAGNPLGPAFQVNQYSLGHQRNPSVAMLADGGFVVAWDGFGPIAGEGRNIYLRRYDATGAPRGPEQVANTLVAGNQFVPALAAAPDGGFAVAWEEAVPGDSIGVALRRYDASGAPRDAVEFLPYSQADVDLEQSKVSLAYDAAGVLTVAWESYDFDLDATSVAARRYGPHGTPSGPATTLALGAGANVSLNSYTRPAVAAGPAGSTVVAWLRTTAKGDQIELVRIGQNGQATAAPLPVSPLPTDMHSPDLGAPAVTVDGDGQTLVVWPDATTLSEEQPVGLAARLIGAAGPEGDQFFPALPAPYAETAVESVALAAAPGPEGDLIIAWHNEQSIGSAPIGSIYMRRYTAPAVTILAGGALRVREGGAPLSLKVALRSVPLADVTLTLTPSNPQIRLGDGAPGAPLTLTFSPANALTPREVLVAAVDDSAVEGLHSATIALSLASAGDPIYAAAPILLDGVASASISVSIEDNDGPTPSPSSTVTSTPTVTPTLTPTSGPAPGTPVYRLYLPTLVR